MNETKSNVTRPLSFGASTTLHQTKTPNKFSVMLIGDNNSDFKINNFYMLLKEPYINSGQYDHRFSVYAHDLISRDTQYTDSVKSVVNYCKAFIDDLSLDRRMLKSAVPFLMLMNLCVPKLLDMAKDINIEKIELHDSNSIELTVSCTEQQYMCSDMQIIDGFFTSVILKAGTNPMLYKCPFVSHILS